MVRMRETSAPARSPEPGAHAGLTLTSRAEDPHSVASSGMCGAQPENPPLSRLFVKGGVARPR